ncbi:MAG: ABC transporter permease [Oscillospiraceae bacterium]|nr:ABC transporter permease [Oscillospiraceae bacterium]
MLRIMIKRNSLLYFKDKGAFFTSMITPMILLVLYVTFLANVYKDTLLASLPQGMPFDESLIDGCVSGQLLSALLAVCCVTVAFCSNLIMVQDKVTGAKRDIDMTPAKPFTISMSYFIATFLNTVLVCLLAAGACLIYISIVGWYMSAMDVLALLGDVVLLSLFGTALSSIINSFLSTQGQISGVSAIVSAVYGFVCGAYMPMSSFSEGLRTALCFLPGTYGTSLLRNHALGGVFGEMEALGVPGEFVDGIRDTLDCNLYVFENKIPMSLMYGILGLTVLLLIAAFVLLSARKKKLK